jgi:hypothetical protein
MSHIPDRDGADSAAGYTNNRRAKERAAFLLARIAEDEALAQACLTKEALTPYSDSRIPPVKPEEWGALVDNYLGGEMGTYCAHFNPLRTLAECAAKRAIIEEYDGLTFESRSVMDSWEPYRSVMRTTLHQMVQVYRGHPDYQESWTR